MNNGAKKVTVKTAVYPLEAIYAACYSLMDRAYFHLDGDPQKQIRVSIKEKAGAARKGGPIADEFENELLHHALRLKISKANQKIREYIVTQALVSSQPAGALSAEKIEPLKKQAEGALDKELEAEIERLLAEAEKQGSQEDPLAIAVPWEEKFGESKTKGKKKGKGQPTEAESVSEPQVPSQKEDETQRAEGQQPDPKTVAADRQAEPKPQERPADELQQEIAKLLADIESGAGQAAPAAATTSRKVTPDEPEIQSGVVSPRGDRESGQGL